MEKLWSPWRSKYIESFKSKDGKDETCIFCAAKEQDITSDECIKIYDGKNVFIMLNLYPYNNGHLMVVPKRHISDFNSLTPDEFLELGELVKKAINAFDEVMKPHGYNFGANLGKAAGAGIDSHLHFHIVPRWTGDTNFMPVLGNVKIISQDLLQTKKDLIEALKNLD